MWRKNGFSRTAVLPCLLDSILSSRSSSFARAGGDGHFDPLAAALDDQFDGRTDLQRVDGIRVVVDVVELLAGRRQSEEAYSNSCGLPRW